MTECAPQLRREATGDMHLSALIALGLVLFLITFLVLALARLLLREQATL